MNGLNKFVLTLFVVFPITMLVIFVLTCVVWAFLHFVVGII